MILPLGDEPNPRGVPVVTYGLMLVNCAVYFLVTLPLSFMRPELNDPAVIEYVRVVLETLSRPVSQRGLEAIAHGLTEYDMLVFEWGFRPAAPQTLDLFTAMFLHGGLLHLAGNMLFLWIYGDNVEHRLGRGRFLIAYLGTGVAATLFYTVLAGQSQLPMLGASGAISGVLGFYFVWFPRNRVRLWVMLFPFFMNVIHAPARWVLGFYVIADNLLPFLVSAGTGGGGVAYGAHLGGFLGGLGVAWAIDRRSLLVRPTDFVTPGQTAASLSLEGSLASLIEGGDYEEAAKRYFTLPPRETKQLGESHSLVLGNWMAAKGYARAALLLFQRHLRDYPIGSTAAAAHVGAGLLQLRAFGQPTAAYQHLVEALGLDPSSETETLARQGLAQIAALQKFQLNSL
ncbi:MAG: rhomboid family intramembrane serine protease [Vicinamibacterales bacterium]|jgi:membrane associated rhomboid family serine protease|nr:rhomboid family intramembrane serine protease [Vicinamibacterales bacterium]MDP7478610.1 rhomboid family intramembrane serine protease [Vicinamibacterales bacterium]MDP7692721.1 rhomboid family intramembrane serine protease [Vicinamibacterales bacterium]HJN46486.1 rhomboid family intramembrane serine protease [Vicinamibacterales bacterium]